MEETKGYRQSCAKTVQRASCYAIGKFHITMRLILKLLHRSIVGVEGEETSTIVIGRTGQPFFLDFSSRGAMRKQNTERCYMR